ncbi:hypothetical protein [Caulobacter segnis]
MTFSTLEHRIVAIGLKLTVAIGFVACLAFVGSFFIDRPAGGLWLKASGCVIAMDLVAMVYLAACQAVVAACRRREGA